MTTKRESALIHSALCVELADVIAVAKDKDVHRDALVAYLVELRRQIGQCGDRQCRVNKRADAALKPKRKT